MVYTYAQLVQLAQESGFGANAPMAAAIAMAESGGNPSAVGHNPGSVDRGLWQINSRFHPEVSDACAFSPSCSAQAALRISNGGRNWQPWATFSNGAYKRYLQVGGASVSSAAQAIAGWWSHTVEQAFMWSSGNTSAHSGEDIALPCGSALASASNGTVLNAGFKPWGGQIDVLSSVPGYGNVVLSYLHLSSVGVRPGQQVSYGQQLGASGQPPPGKGYGSGCHLHFELTHGSVAPYQGQYSPHSPTATSYPLNPASFINSLKAGAGASGIVQGITLGDVTTQSLNPLQPFIDFISALGTIKDWLSNPIRIVKMIVGASLIIAGIFITFLPEAAAGVAVAAGQPELAPAAYHAGATIKHPVKTARHTVQHRVQRQEQRSHQQHRKQTAKGARKP